jgi:hypothetical protein
LLESGTSRDKIIDSINFQTNAPQKLLIKNPSEINNNNLIDIMAAVHQYSLVGILKSFSSDNSIIVKEIKTYIDNNE